MKYLCLASALAFSLFIAEQANAATELEQRAAVSAATQESFFTEDFKRLERVAKKYRTEKSRTSSGLWNLTLFYAGIEEAIEAEIAIRQIDASVEAVEEKTRKWAQAFPDSPTGYIAHSMALLERAWAHRRQAPPDSPDTSSQVNEYIATARANLETFKSVASVDPRWYQTMVIIARNQNWDRSAFDALVNEALEREPLFYQTYFSAQEKWRGNIREIEDFAQKAVLRTKEQEGHGMYARIYWYASQSEFRNDLFSNSLVDWVQMKEGFEDIIKRYPDPWNLNNYARFACLAGDKPKTRELLKRIESSVVPEAWMPEVLKPRCTEWASQP
jgi:hypothetical protein